MLSRFIKLNSHPSSFVKYNITITNIIRKFSKDIDIRDKDNKEKEKIDDEKIKIKERFTVRSITPDPKSYLRVLNETTEKLKNEELEAYYNSDHYKKYQKRKDLFKKINRLFLAIFLFNATISFFEIYTKYPESDLDTLLIYSLPARFGSRCWGFVNNINLPEFLRVRLFQLWTNAFGCNLEEAKYPLPHYKNLAEFFCRPLKDGVRPIAKDTEMVSPSDGLITKFGTVRIDGKLEQIKGSFYKLSDFLQATPIIDPKNELYYCVVYLAPGDYHRIHSSFDGKITSRYHVPGRALSVAPWFLERYPNVFSENERVVLSGEWNHGFYSLTAVSAFNVANIKLAFDEEVHTNGWFQPNKLHEYLPYDQPKVGYAGADANLTRHHYFRKYDIPLEVKKGDEIARFELGSTVVVVFEAPKNFGFSVNPFQKIKMGEALGQCGKNLPKDSTQATTLLNKVKL